MEIDNNMDTKNIPFQTIDWSKIPKTEHVGETGVAYWQTIQLQQHQIKMVGIMVGG